MNKVRTTVDGQAYAAPAIGRAGRVDVASLAAGAFAASSRSAAVGGMTIGTCTASAAAPVSWTGSVRTDTDRIHTVIRNRVTVSGAVQKTDLAGRTTPAAGVRGAVLFTRDGSTTTTVLGGTRADERGRWSLATTAITASGTVRFRTTPTTGLPSLLSPPVPVTFLPYQPAVTLASTTTVPSTTGGAARYTFRGTVNRTLDGVTTAAAGVPVSVYLVPASGAAPRRIGSVTSTSTGTWAWSYVPNEIGRVTFQVLKVAGYADSAVVSADVTAPARPTLRAAVVSSPTRALRLTSVLSPGRPGTLVVERLSATGTYEQITTLTVNARGIGFVDLPPVPGSYLLRARFAGDVAQTAGVSATIRATVR